MDTSKATARLSASVGQIRHGRGANKGRTFADGYVTRDGIEVGAIGCVDVETTERIVRAVNSHEALVAALRGIIQAWDTDSGDYYVTNTLTDDDIDQARAALALAEQG